MGYNRLLRRAVAQRGIHNAKGNYVKPGALTYRMATSLRLWNELLQGLANPPIIADRHMPNVFDSTPYWYHLRNPL